MIHLGRRRNANECCGAYGHELSWDEMNWLADWCFVRGVNLLYPHAFYYSVHGPRWDERPPDVGPHNPWWERFHIYADRCRRLAWLNTDCTHVCSIAILGAADYLPWQAAKVCFQHQRDFNYLEERHLWEDAKVDEHGVHIGGMHYRVVILDHTPHPQTQAALQTLSAAGRLIHYDPARAPEELVAQLDALTPPDVVVTPPAPALRIRHLIKEGRHVYLLHNEEVAPLTVRLQVAVSGRMITFDPTTTVQQEITPGEPLHLAGHALQVLVVPSSPQT